MKARDLFVVFMMAIVMAFSGISLGCHNLPLPKCGKNYRTRYPNKWMWKPAKRETKRYVRRHGGCFINTISE